MRCKGVKLYDMENISSTLWSFLIIQLLVASSIKCLEFRKDFNATVEFILGEVDPDSISSFLRNLTARPHVGGTPAELETANYISDIWKSQGLDEVHMTPYEVLLSYPEMEKPNYVRIHNKKGKEMWKSQGRTPPLYAEEEQSKEIFPDFNAYSAPGRVQGGIIYVNFGSEADYRKLEDLGVDIKGHIVIAKYGQRFRANIAKSAENRGAIGVLFYPDPQQYAQDGPHRVYPDTVFMPGTAAPFGTTNVGDGDPLTPFYPSTESAFRIPVNETMLPKIPIMPLGYNDASFILSQIGGILAPSEWQGGLNLTYKVGPGLAEPGWDISMEVNTHNQNTTTYNVIGVMEGKVEPDRYVVLGNHHDAWIFGAVDPSSGTAALLELTRTLTEYRKQTGWAPRRSLVFCSWGSEEYGLVGSMEWGEQFSKQLAARSIAYLNVDMAIAGNYSLRSLASPLLYDVGREIAKLVPNPDIQELIAGRATVYDTWALRKPDKNRPGYPMFSGIDGGSDHKVFQHILGIPSHDYMYDHSDEMFAEPLYHTVYETFYLVSELYDRGFHFQAAITQLWGLLATSLADTEIIPFSLDEYAAYISDAQEDFYKKYVCLLRHRNITLDYFLNACEEFKDKVESFKKVVESINKTDVLAVRRVNDQMMMIDRAFLDPRGLPGRPAVKHVVTSPSASDAYGVTAFPGLTDTLAGIRDLPEDEQEQQWRVFEEHLAACTHLLKVASKVLTEELW